MQPFVVAALLGLAVADTQYAANTQDTQACARSCNDAYNACHSQPGADQSACNTNWTNCLGWQPSAGQTATACANNNGGGQWNQGGGQWQTWSSTSAWGAGATPAPGQVDDCAQRCNTAYDQCRYAAGADQSSCSTQYTNCLGYTPANGGNGYQTATACATNGVAPTNTVPRVGGAAQLSPAYAAMAVGLVALL